MSKTATSNSTKCACSIIRWWIHLYLSFPIFIWRSSDNIRIEFCFWHSMGFMVLVMNFVEGVKKSWNKRLFLLRFVLHWRKIRHFLWFFFNGFLRWFSFQERVEKWRIGRRISAISVFDICNTQSKAVIISLHLMFKKEKWRSPVIWLQHPWPLDSLSNLFENDVTLILILNPIIEMSNWHSLVINQQHKRLKKVRLKTKPRPKKIKQNCQAFPLY